MLNSLRCLALILPLLVPCTIRAEVKIAPDCRVKNRPPGRCGWCALETLARHLGLQAMYGLTEKHPSQCSPHSLEECLKNTSISYRIQYPGRLSEDILRYAIRADLGAAVGLRGSHPCDEKHIVTLVEFRDDSVKVIDPNDADCRTRQMSMERFRRWWDGFALVLEPGSDWTNRSKGGGELDAARRPLYGSFLPSVSKKERDGSIPDLWRRSKRARSASNGVLSCLLARPSVTSCPGRTRTKRRIYLVGKRLTAIAAI